MTTIRVFDPAMCCSTGVCGPSVDSGLIRFAADLDWLRSEGVLVERFNLSQEPAAFAGDEDVKTALEAKGEEGLPLVKVDGVVKSVGVYPSRGELAAWCAVGAPTAVEAAATKTEEGACCAPAASPSKSGCC